MGLLRKKKDSTKSLSENKQLDLDEVQLKKANEAYENKNYADANKIYFELAQKGMAKAQVTIGISYQLGNGVKQDYTEAIKWYQKAADAGNRKAMRYLGILYEEGKGVNKDPEMAFAWCEKAGNLGDQIARDDQIDIPMLPAFSKEY